MSTEVRKLIRSGLEAIRCVDSQSGHQDVRLLSALARLFSAQAVKAQEDGDDEQLVTSLFLRASHYWSCAKPTLENIKSGRYVRLSSQDRFFHLSGYYYSFSITEPQLINICDFAAKIWTKLLLILCCMRPVSLKECNWCAIIDLKRPSRRSEISPVPMLVSNRQWY